MSRHTNDTDRTPRYTVKEVADMLDISVYTIRYYDNAGLIPALRRTEGNIRLFSDYSVSWLRLVLCLRATGLSIDGIRRYIDLCMEGDATIAARAEIIFQQERVLRTQIKELQKQMELLKHKKEYYRQLLRDQTVTDSCNPLTRTIKEKNEAAYDPVLS